MAHEFEGAVCDYLVGIHVHGSAGAALHHVHRELVMEFSGNYFLAGLYDCVSDLAVKHAQFCVCGSCSHLDVCHCNDIFRIVAHPGVGDLVIVESTLCLYAIVGIGRNLKFPQKVTFDPEFLF